jgi:hypothetical protein
MNKKRIKYFEKCVKKLLKKINVNIFVKIMKLAIDISFLIVKRIETTIA